MCGGGGEVGKGGICRYCPIYWILMHKVETSDKVQGREFTHPCIGFLIGRLVWGANRMKHN